MAVEVFDIIRCPACANRRIVVMTADQTSDGRAKRTERLLLIGNYGNGNIGDDAILTQLAPKALTRGEVTVLSRHPDRISALNRDVRTAAMVSSDALLAFVRADTIVVGGGGMFGRGLPPLVACLPFVLLAATAVGKDVELQSIGAYPNTPRPVAWALRSVARRARHVSARDAASVEALGGPDHATLVRDPAWDLEPAGQEVVDAVLSESGVHLGRPMIAVSLKPGAGNETVRRCVAAVAEALDLWAAPGDCEIVFLSFSDKGDYRLGADQTDYDLGVMLRGKMENGRFVRFIGPGLHPAVMLGVVQRCCGMVAMRLHAQIFALAVGRPVFGLSFESKCDEFLSSAGVTPVRPDEVSVDELGQWLKRVAPPKSAHT